MPLLYQSHSFGDLLKALPSNVSTLGFQHEFFWGAVEGWDTNIQTIATSVLEGREGLLVQLFIFQVLTLMWPYWVARIIQT